ncbi:MAG TPA: multicopper oxidase domain-containing protein, partial [Propionibacteriaceae bacterium]|nr:multicopper oxidase domain-containing protein [Propionibacteriaceae bacterium]
MTEAPGPIPTDRRPPQRRPQVVRDGIVALWLAAAIVVALAHQWVPGAVWVMIHLVLLGALSHAALVWSEHFSHTLLRARVQPRDERLQDLRALTLGAGALLALVGVPAQVWPVVASGAALVIGALGWHGVHLWRTMRGALPGRFRIVIRYYLAASLCLPLGAVFGATLAWGLSEEWRGRLLIAHLAANLLGWIGLTVTGTLITFWPTILRTRLDERAERLSRQALPQLSAGVVVISTGALLGAQWVAALGLVGYFAGLIWWGRALLRPLHTKPPREFASASVAASLVWAIAGLAWLGAILVSADAWPAVLDAIPPVAAVFVVGFAAQLLTGALSYLLPSVLGGGASVVRASRRWFDRGTTLRLTLINAGLLLWLFPGPSWVKVTVSTLVLMALAAFLPLAVGGVRASLTARTQTPGDASPPPEASVWSTKQLVAAATALVVAVAVGMGIDPVAAGLGGRAGVADVVPTGNTTRVEVTAHGMTFTPDRVSVPRGDRLVIVLTNTDPTTTHDLVLGDIRTPRLRGGETAELDAGIIGASTQGWCTVAGHRQMGMVFTVVVDGESPSTASTHQEHGDADDGTAAALTRTVDPVLPPLTADRVRKVTFRVQEVPLEVAPGVWQRRWTFNGTAPGPTLHGRVGDTFEVTLINDGSIGHSIDFHAGVLAPDEPMRTIPPGASLVYRFTAERAGIWMYHCSTMPMSTHIAAGMHGAVVIEPDELPEVDRSYVIVQSEVHLDTPASTAGDAAEVDAASVSADTPDLVVFNGIANQYDAHPLSAQIGERVRIWVLDAGPSRA